jgi:hypothetical protein
LHLSGTKIYRIGPEAVIRGLKQADPAFGPIFFPGDTILAKADLAPAAGQVHRVDR